MRPGQSLQLQLLVPTLASGRRLTLPRRVLGTGLVQQGLRVRVMFVRVLLAGIGMALADRADSAVPHNQGVGVVAGHGVSGVCTAGPGGRDREAGSLVATTGHGLIGIDTETNAGVSGTGSSTLSATTEARCESRWRLASSTDLVLEDSQLP